jgi:hypothetical protein
MTVGNYTKKKLWRKEKAWLSNPEHTGRRALLLVRDTRNGALRPDYPAESGQPADDRRPGGVTTTVSS